MAAVAAASPAGLSQHRPQLWPSAAGAAAASSMMPNTKSSAQVIMSPCGAQSAHTPSRSAAISPPPLTHSAARAEPLLLQRSPRHRTLLPSIYRAASAAGAESAGSAGLVTSPQHSAAQHSGGTALTTARQLSFGATAPSSAAALSAGAFVSAGSQLTIPAGSSRTAAGFTPGRAADLRQPPGVRHSEALLQYPSLPPASAPGRSVPPSPPPSATAMAAAVGGRPYPGI